MKISLVLGVVLSCVASTAFAVKLNPEAMRTMQAEGEKFAQQAMQPRTFRLSTGLCLTVAKGNGVIAATCEPKLQTQVWRLDDKGRVVHSSGLCLATAGKAGEPGTKVVSTACGMSAQFKWRPNANGQLVNGGKACLNAFGNIKQSGAGVNTAVCKAVPNQLWK